LERHWLQRAQAGRVVRMASFQRPQPTFSRDDPFRPVNIRAVYDDEDYLLGQLQQAGCQRNQEDGATTHGGQTHQSPMPHGYATKIF
jgi:hypothetical protein